MPRADLARLALARLALTGLAGLTAGPALSQALSGATLSATIAQRFEADTNYNLDDPRPGTSYFADTRIELGLLSESANQTFELGLNTGLRALWQAEEDFDLTFASPTTATLGYDRAWAGAEFGADFDYTAAEVDFTRSILIDADGGGVPDDLAQIDDDSTEYRTDAALELALATDAPSSYTFSLDATNIDYSVTSSDQVPRTTVLGEALWTLRFTPVLAGALLGSYFYYDGDDDQETEVNVAELDAGFFYQPTPELELRAGIGFANRTREETIDDRRRTTEDESGPTARFGANYDFEDFQVFLNSRVTTAAPKTRFLGDLTVQYPLPRATLSLRAFQTYFGDSSGDESRFTGAGIGLIRELTPVSTLGLDLQVAQQANQDNPAAPEIERFDASVTYSYALTEVVSADLGYRYSQRREDPEDATGNAVFIQIGRTFETRP